MKKLSKFYSVALATLITSSCLLSNTAITSSANVQYVNDSFENNYDGWVSTTDEVELTSSNLISHESARGMRITDRNSSDDGAISDKGFYLLGGKEYTYSAWVYTENSSDNKEFNLAVGYMQDGEFTSFETIASKATQGGKWIQLVGDFKAPEDAHNISLKITADGVDDFYFDDVVISAKETYLANTVSADTKEVGLKDVFNNYFKFGACLSQYSMYNSSITDIALREFNSITCENELKPSYTMNLNESTNDNISVNLRQAASIIDFCVNNNLPMRGHTLVWHNQTDIAFFKEDFNGGKNWVSPDVMDKRMESYIKNLFGAIETQYPDLDLYAYDVVNEAFQDNGTPRVAGTNIGNGESPWVQVYGGNSFVEKAFTYARKYAPEDCKLFYNDYNEYIVVKRDAIYNMAQDFKKKGIIDGIGMQSHVVMHYPDATLYRQALDKYATLGLDIQVTELDIQTDDTSENGLKMQGDRYKELMSILVDYKDYVSCVAVWGVTDDKSWLSAKKPLLFNADYSKKPAYDAIVSLIPEDQWGEGSTPGGGSSGSANEPDENGYYFHSTFEDNNYGGWDTRGEGQTNIKPTPYMGDNSLAVTGRTDSWNGTAKMLSGLTFKPGNAYSFSAFLMYQNGQATEDFQLTLQYDVAGVTNYAAVGTLTANKNEWAKIENTEYLIPEGAENMVLYLEAPSLIDFYVDEAIGAVPGTVNNGKEPATTTYKKGDLNNDDAINSIDVALLKRGIITSFTTPEAEKAADFNGDGKVSILDVMEMIKHIIEG